MTRLGDALADMRAKNNQSLRAQAVAITLLLLTGCRRGGILSLQWNGLGLKDSKTWSEGGLAGARVG